MTAPTILPFKGESPVEAEPWEQALFAAMTLDEVHAALAMRDGALTASYDENEPRDDHGRWYAGGAEPVGVSVGGFTEDRTKDPDRVTADALSAWPFWGAMLPMRYAGESLLGLDHPGLSDMTVGSQREAGIIIEGLAGERELTGSEAQSAQDAVEGAAALLRAIDDQIGPALDLPLYRGMQVDDGPARDALFGLEPGEKFDMGISSFTPDEDLAGGFGGDVRLIIEADGAKALANPVDEASVPRWPGNGVPTPGEDPGHVPEWVQVPVEYLTQGRFEVVDRKVYGAEHSSHDPPGVLDLYIRQVDTFDIDAKKSVARAASLSATDYERVPWWELLSVPLRANPPPKP